MKNVRKLNTFIENCGTLKFGDFILFQEYSYSRHNINFSISKPILAIFLGDFIADQTLGFDYIKWYKSEANSPNLETTELPKITNHVEWDDYIDILGMWSYRPNFRELLSAYRSQNIARTANDKEVEV